MHEVTGTERSLQFFVSFARADSVRVWSYRRFFVPFRMPEVGCQPAVETVLTVLVWVARWSVR